jgi:DNA-binding response OmpR family regulator
MANKTRILCIEDEEEIINLLRMLLEMKGFEVFDASGGLKGLEIAKREKPDLVLLDLMMPDIDGWEVYRRMKADEEMASIPVIVVTAKAQNVDRALGLQVAKVDDYVTKPFGPRELLASIEAVLAKKKPR